MKHPLLQALKEKNTARFRRIFDGIMHKKQLSVIEKARPEVARKMFKGK